MFEDDFDGSFAEGFDRDSRYFGDESRIVSPRDDGPRGLRTTATSTRSVFSFEDLEWVDE